MNTSAPFCRRRRRSLQNKIPIPTIPTIPTTIPTTTTTQSVVVSREEASVFGVRGDRDVMRRGGFDERKTNPYKKTYEYKTLNIKTRRMTFFFSESEDFTFLCGTFLHFQGVVVLRRPPTRLHVREDAVDSDSDSDSDEEPHTGSKNREGASSSRRNHLYGVDETKTNQSRAIVSNAATDSRERDPVRRRVFDAQRARENERDETRRRNIKQKQQRCCQNEKYFRWSNRCCRTTWE